MTHRMSFYAVASFAPILLGVCMPVLAAPAPSASMQVSGDVQTPGAWDVARVRRDLKADVQVVHYTLKGQSHTADCVPLLSVIDAAHPAVNSRIKHHDLQFMVSVQGFDGYTVDFSMAELLPEIGNRTVWVALDEDGKPLAGEGGAVDILVPGDVKPARWVHGVTAITVVDCSKLPPAQ